jgi:hypothetical protein
VERGKSNLLAGMRDDGREVRRSFGHSNEPAIQVICLVSRSQSLSPWSLLLVIYAYMERGILPVVLERHDEKRCRHIMVSTANIARALEVVQVKTM